MLLKCFQMAIVVSFLNKYFRRVTSRRKMPQMCSEISRNASHKSSLVGTGQGSYCLWSVVSRWTEDMRPFRICSDSRPQSPSFLSHVVLRVRDFGLFWFGIGYDFRGNYGSVWTYLSFQFKMSKKSLRKKEKYDMRILNRFLELFCLRSNLSNNDIISV